MKKIFKFIKKKFKLVIAFSIGLVVASTGVYAANTIYSKNVTYDNTNSGLDSTNVQDALDETYRKCSLTSSKDNASNYIIDLYNDGSLIETVNIGGSISNPEVHLNTTQGIMLDNNGNYRYYGENPNNYVTFNNETWRVIGVFNNVDDGAGNIEKRLKITRSESIGKYSFDTSESEINAGYGANDWSRSELMVELNTMYYSRSLGTCYDGYNNSTVSCDFTSIGLDLVARGMIDDAVYYLGGYSDSNIYADDFYNYERGTTVYDCDNKNDGACPRAITWIGKVGLIYPSDYAYATDLNLCTETADNYDDLNCYSNDWLLYLDQLYDVQFTITQSLSREFYMICIVGSGEIGKNCRTNTSGSVLPTVYLKSSITITGGTGTITDPYILE